MGWWQARKCDRGNHKLEKAYAAIWGGGYYVCTNCGKREVCGGDSYGPHAPLWKAYGAPPPTLLSCLSWTNEDWDKWADKIRRDTARGRN